MNRAARRRLKGQEPLQIETHQHRKLVKFKPFLLGFLVLCVILFIGVFVFYNQFYHNELGAVKMLGSDKSVIYVQEDGTFEWYRAKWGKDEVITDGSDYLAGVMRYYTGKDAYRMLDKYSEHFWNITSDTIDEMYDEMYRKEDLFIMIIKGVYFKETEGAAIGKDNSEYVKYYLGFRHDNYLDIMEQEGYNLFQFQIVED